MKRGLGLIIIFLLLSSLGGFAQAAGDNRVQNGSIVMLKYYFEADGKPVVAAGKQEGMRVVLGRGTYPADFERQLIGLRAGDKKTITLNADQGFGTYQPELVRRIPKAQLPPAFANIKEGSLISSGKGGRPMRVTKIFDDAVEIDGNHPLAGKKLVYHVEIENVS